MLLCQGPRFEPCWGQKRLFFGNMAWPGPGLLGLGCRLGYWAWAAGLAWSLARPGPRKKGKKKKKNGLELEPPVPEPNQRFRFWKKQTGTGPVGAWFWFGSEPGRTGSGFHDPLPVRTTEPWLGLHICLILPAPQLCDFKKCML